MFEVTKPSYQHGVQAFDDLLYALPTGTFGLGTDAIPQGSHTFLTDPSFSGFESITQKLEALTYYRTIPYMRLVRVKRQTVFRNPGPYLGKRRLGRFRTWTHHDKISRIEFVILQTGRSPPVAPHPASRRRSYLRLQARRAIDLKRTFTSLTSCAHGRTESGFQPRSCNHVYRATFTKPSEPN